MLRRTLLTCGVCLIAAPIADASLNAGELSPTVVIASATPTVPFPEGPPVAACSCDSCEPVYDPELEAMVLQCVCGDMWESGYCDAFAFFCTIGGQQYYCSECGGDPDYPCDHIAIDAVVYATASIGADGSVVAGDSEAGELRGRVRGCHGVVQRLSRAGPVSAVSSSVAVVL